jgi:hypothetical protein
MKTPRHLQPWYNTRLRDARKPEPMTEAERLAASEENRRILANSAEIVAAGIRRGWISHATRKDPVPTWIPSNTPTDQTPPSSFI